MITLNIDGNIVQVEEGTKILNAAKKVGIEIPTLCYHQALAPYGACRICTVEIIRGNVSRLQAACAYPAEEGIEVKTNTEKVLQGRRMIVELLLARCPEVKKICDLAEEMGIKRQRFKTEVTQEEAQKRIKENDCILCGLCARVCSEIVGIHAIGFSNRGINRVMDTPFQLDSDVCIGCGTCTYVCPTGAVQMEAEAVEKFLKLPAFERFCRYARMGLVSQKVCPNNYQCWHCEVDQRLEEMFGTHPALVVKPAELKKISDLLE